MAEVFDRGDSVLLKMQVKKWVTKERWDYCDPDSIKVRVTKNSTVIVNDADMLKDNDYVGFYYYIWQTSPSDAVGEYAVEITTVIGASSEVTKDVVELK